MINIVMTKKDIDFSKPYNAQDEIAKGLIKENDYEKVKEKLESFTEEEEELC